MAQISENPVSTPNSFSERAARVDWVDCAKGICIIFVVMMHTTLGLGKASGETGWMHAVVDFAQPFRMPDFFMISGLFLAATIDRPWRHYIDRKVIHFFYFYALWVVIQFAFKAPFMVAEGTSPAQALGLLAFTAVQPFGTLWFIYMLPVFFVVAKLFRNHGMVLLGLAVVLHLAPINTTAFMTSVETTLGLPVSGHGWVLIDEFCSRLVYFVAGYLFASRIFALAELARAHVALSLIALAVWAIINGTFVVQGWSMLPGIALALGAAGAGAIILASSLISRLKPFAALSALGANSIVVYLAFFLPMIISRIVMLKFTPWIDPGTMALIGTTIGVVAPMIGYAIIRRVGFGLFLFHRPNWAVLSGTPWKRERGPKAALQPAE